MKKRIKLLLTCSLGYYMKDTIACLKASDLYDVTIVGTDMNPMKYNVNDIDIFYRTSRSDAPEYFDNIFQIATKEHVDVVMPLHSKELVPFAEKRKLFEDNGITLAVPPLEGLRIANDKILSYSHMRQIGLPTPLTFITDDATEAVAFLKEHMGMTFVTKLPDSCGARGFHVVGMGDSFSVNGNIEKISDEQQLRELINGSTLLQSYLAGTEYTVDLLMQEGKCVASLVKECQLVEHGVIRQARIVEDESVAEPCKQFAESLGLHGNIGFDLKCDEYGTPFIIDVNPRLTATIAFGKVGGLNLPAMGLELFLGKRVERYQSAKAGACIVRQIADYYFNAEGEPVYI